MAVLQTAVMYTLKQTCCQRFWNHFEIIRKFFSTMIFLDFADLVFFIYDLRPFLWDKGKHCMRRPKPGAANPTPELGRLYKILIKMSTNIHKTRNGLVHSIKIQ